MNLRDTMRGFEAAHPRLASRQLAPLFLRQRNDAVILALLVAEFEHIKRERARFVEIEEAPKFAIASLGSQARADRWSERYRSIEVALGDGCKSTFGQMTVAEHRIRIAMLTKLREGLSSTISRHEDAVADIERAGVGCLDDLSTAPLRRAA